MSSGDPKSTTSAEMFFQNTVPFTDARGRDVDAALGATIHLKPEGTPFRETLREYAKFLNKWPLMLLSPLSFRSYKPARPPTPRRDELLSFTQTKGFSTPSCFCLCSAPFFN